MRLEEITLRLRRRTAWEALDLGHAMLRAWAGPAYRAWFATYWLAGIVLAAVFWLVWDWPAGGTLVLWWLKPLFDRVLLFCYSRALFGQSTSVLEVWRAVPGILRQPGVLSGLTLRRFSLSRSFLLPVWQLEAQAGAAARARFRVLGRRASGSALWLTFVCVHLVAILWFSLILLALFLAPVGSEDWFDWHDLFFSSGEVPLWMDALVVLFSLVAESLVEPLYVASGFSLYLNRRSDLEGWDIDLAFRRLAARLQEGARDAALRVGGLLFCLCVFAMTLPEAANAQEPARAVGKLSASHPKQVIREVLRDPVFGQETQEKEWRAKAKGEAKSRAEQEPPSPWLRKLARWMERLVEGLRVMAWGVALLLAAALLYVVIRFRDRWWPGQRELPPPPDFLFGLDVRPESLPDDVAAAAQVALAAGRVEEALSLLYRGALVALIHRVQLEFRAGDTEDDCLRRVRGRIEAAAEEYFAALLRQWRLVAYARCVPPLPVLEALCTDWPRHFGSAGKGA